MDNFDRKICAILQTDARRSSTDVATHVGLSVSATNDRIRRLQREGIITHWQARLDPQAFQAALCAFVLLDLSYDGEAAAVATLTAHDAVQELHHISGPHSYLMKLRLADTAALQRFLNEVVKPLPAVTRTESIIAMDTAKETLALSIPRGNDCV
ncbi:Lrp/AsnC family transcriptional regulator [Thalassobius sp. Cn5-15]|jgi:Lrp/AsnC family leucine-responsive transcriptional regulator|uniref:Lrp/AsnC family transcriptional regulator n=1 Tax=Thalassobius sp. Cn5-15 TaxID=2917763 RepID=UPI001EF34E2E|nr:Lrp/AsnC family transcriptional regulator [Thalassobius sp. Cn5-15]MCG7493536.1 Lrp/AsnC family transcriptional regulator [Thalassobius sp. Cn5-15]